LYPICHASVEIFGIASLPVDRAAAPVHFWDPMLSRLTNTRTFALDSASMPFARSMMTTIITMTTPMRGASG
jgi:hypothetical protein